jgi:hypothetical protein
MSEKPAPLSLAADLQSAAPKVAKPPPDCPAFRQDGQIRREQAQCLCSTFMRCEGDARQLVWAVVPVAATSAIPAWVPYSFRCDFTRTAVGGRGANRCLSQAV